MSLTYDALDIEAAVAAAVSAAVTGLGDCPTCHVEIDNADVIVRIDRSCSAADERQVTISCAAALVDVRIALERAGLDIVVSEHPDPRDLTVLARVVVRGLAGPRVLPETVAALEAAATAEGARLQLLTAPDERRALADLVGGLEEAPVLAILATQGDGPMAWLAAGQALERVRLAAARDGLRASVVDRASWAPELRAPLSSLLASPGVAQIALRLDFP